MKSSRSRTAILWFQYYLFPPPPKLKSGHQYHTNWDLNPLLPGDTGTSQSALPWILGSCFWYSKENWTIAKLKSYISLTSYRYADSEGITSGPFRTRANRYVVRHCADCRHTTCTRTRILTFVANARLVHWTVWTHKTFWPTTFIWISMIFWYALTHGKCVFYATMSIRSTWWRVAWISSRRWWWWWHWKYDNIDYTADHWTMVSENCQSMHFKCKLSVKALPWLNSWNTSLIQEAFTYVIQFSQNSEYVLRHLTFFFDIQRTVRCDIFL